MSLAICNGGQKTLRGWLAPRLGALRAFSFPVSVLPPFLATAVVLPAKAWNWPVLLACAIGAGLLHAGGNLFNDFFDFRHGVDRKMDGDENRPGRQLVKGQLRPGDVLAEALACLAAGAVLAAYVTWAAGWGILWFALAGVVSLYAYTGPPLRLKYRAMGEFTIFVTFGPLLMLGAAYAQTGHLEWQALLASLPVGMATTAILTGNNIRDLEEDASAGIRTLTTVLGLGGMKALYVSLVCLAVAMVAAFAVCGLFPRVLMGAPLLLALLRHPLASLRKDIRLSDIDARTAQFETVLLLAMLAAFVVDGWAK